MKKLIATLVVASSLSVMAGASFANQVSTTSKPIVTPMAFFNLPDLSDLVIPDIKIGGVGGVQLTGNRHG